MRPLGLLGAALSGAPPFAELGTGVPSSNTYLRGDGVWAALSTAPFANKQAFTSSGTFTVPAGVTMLAVMCIGGGGGGGGGGGQNGYAGGTTSFGSHLAALGGGGGGGAGAWQGGQGGGSYDQAAVIAVGGGGGEGIACALISSSGTWGKAGSGAGGGDGGWGGIVLALVPVIPGQQISVTIGAAGSSFGSAASAGACVVRY